MDIVAHINRIRLVAIFRGDYGEKWLDYAAALVAGGVTAMEVTLNSPGAFEGIAAIKAHYGDSIALGAGTVLSALDAQRAVDSGAGFIVAPDTDPTVIDAGKASGVAVIPGAYTPTEIKHAFRLGADMVKVFPSQSPEYIRAVRAPLPHIPIMATGGVTLENAAAFFDAGASALGIGSYLTNDRLSPDEVARRAAQFVATTQGRQRA